MLGDPDNDCGNPKVYLCIEVLDGHLYACAKLEEAPIPSCWPNTTPRPHVCSLHARGHAWHPLSHLLSFNAPLDPTLACMTCRHPHWVFRAPRRPTLDKMS